MIKAIWEKIANNGIDPVSPSTDTAEVRLLNQILFSAFIFSFAAITYATLINDIGITLDILLNMVFELVSLLLIRFKRASIAKILFCFLLPLFVAIQIILMNIGSIGESNLFVLIAFINLIIYRGIPKVQIFSIIYICGLYFGASIYMIENDLLTGPNYNPYNSLITFLLMIIGITFIIIMYLKELQKYEKEKQALIKNLEQVNLELRTFNHIASHDIKEPIRNIGTYAGFIFRKLPEDLKENLEEYFDIIKQSSNQLYTLIEDFSHYSSLARNKSVEKEPLNLNDLLDGIEKALHYSIEEYNGKIINYGLPSINSSSSLLYTTFKNLIENGIKYNTSDEPTVELSYIKTETHHQITLSDNGIGIEKKYHKQVFEMFKRLHNRGEYKGSGMGLSIAKICLEKLGGSIQLKSKVGEGSQFILLLPIEEETNKK